MANPLSQETSPYLLQHQDNPVHWYPWGEKALDLARSENKPILLSVGYAACHWCHVMAHESFENQAIADLMNRHFINIKVDREERPDIDSIYQSALAMMGEQGGWPLTMFLTPDGEPFWGGTYFPPEQRWGRPGFPDILTAISQTYQLEPDKITANVSSLRGGLERLSTPRNGDMPGRLERDQIAYSILPHFDAHHGGFGSAPKFPQASLLRQLWYAGKRTGDKKLSAPVLQALEAMCHGGIYDHLAGGFARYTVDEAWLIPHFEKMLYDNAQLIELLTLAWQETKQPLFASRIEETIAFLLRDMLEETGGFASSFDADSEGEEGLFYVWEEVEIDGILGKDAPAFKKLYNVTAAGNFEGRNILNRLSSESRPYSPDQEKHMAPLRAKLLAVREKRVWPGKDDKVLVDWNGMTIKALAFAGRVFDQPSWINAADHAFQFILNHMMEGKRLLHSWRDNRAQHTAILDDYAHMMQAAIALYQATGKTTYLDHVENWFEIIETHYHDPNGAYFLTADDVTNLICRTKTAMDQAVPSGNGILVEALTAFYCLTGKTLYRERAEEIITTFSGELNQRGFSFSNLLTGAEFLENPIQMVLAGDPTDPTAKSFISAISSASLPLNILDFTGPDRQLPDSHPAHGKAMIDGKATLYLCQGPVCSAPITKINDLEKALSALK
ncbi:thioredoxin domain-containing protein [Aestuariispira insulae]|uniref:Spermatogenesis-associated protein 20-like TRX domain-containing protein n=1 Tax=Aestuariispira insulae TaxID=1461337 RepID=A0A3D9HPD4_9PROT|nr:thioredoxin domain-containing protein [Aestuariispira insulae]RED51358.1 hypothetical protein DFP90_103158 [Aestuariispira insulae]